MNTSRYNFIFQFCSIVFLLGIFLISNNSHASTISLKANANYQVGERIGIDVVIDTEGESINSIESNIKFSPEYLIFNGFSAKQSSVPIWVEEPKEKSPGKIHFSGVIPGGLDRMYDPLNTNSKSILVVKLFFISKNPGTTFLQVTDSSVLKNDGKGSQVSVNNNGIKMSFADVAGRNIDAPIANDINSPKPFTITIVERSLFGKTPRLAVFSAEDEEGGIEYYEMSIGSLSPQVVTSPAALPYRLFDYILTIKAYDFSGNVREQQVTVKGEKSYGLGLGIFGLVALMVLIRYLINRK